MTQSGEMPHPPTPSPEIKSVISKEGEPILPSPENRSSFSGEGPGVRDEIETIGSRIVYQNRWLRLREDQIRRSDGSAGIYSVVEKTDFVVIAAIDHGVIHMVEQYRYPVRQRGWELPQGSWEDQPGTDPDVLARAELQEETGLSAATMIHVGYLYLAYGFSSQGYHIYLARGLSNGERDLDAEEAGLITRAFPLAEVDRMILDGTIKDATTIAALGLMRMKGLIGNER